MSQSDSFTGVTDQPLRETAVLSERAVGRERLIADFEEAYRRGERPSIHDHLAGDGDERRALLLELVHIDLECRLKVGEPVRVEEYLQRYPECTDDKPAVLELICTEYTLRRRTEREISRGEFLQRFVQYGEELVQLLADEPAREQRCETTSVQQAATRPRAEAASGALKLPSEFGRYRIIKELGGGGMGKVYLAHDTQLDRDIALKIPRFGAESTELIQRFYREARAMAALRHQNLCTVHDVGEIDGIHYLTMAYIDGQALTYLTDAGRKLPNRSAAAVIRKLALALHVAHRAGVVHRDLKPANVIIDKASQPVVVDFGLAHRQRTDEQRLTGRGTVMGTPAYMSPEQVEGHLEAIGPASDIYSLGVILYQLLAGRLPFDGSLASIMAQILRDDPPRPSVFNPAVLSPEPLHRPRSVHRDPVAVVDRTYIDHSDREATGPAWNPDRHALVRVVVVLVNQIAVLVVDVEIQVGVPVSRYGYDREFPDSEADFKHVG
jgi:hypothetical protein